MRILVCLLSLLCSPAIAQDVIVARGRVIVSAQEHATIIARRGALVHSSCGQREGIGCGSTPERACEAACFYKDAMRGRYRIVEKGVAYSPGRGMWFAVIRYR